LMTSPPFSGANVGTSFAVVGRAKDPSNRPEARISAVSSEYARTMGTPVLRGRMIDDGDAASAPLVVVINETLAKKYFAGVDPLEKQLDLGGKDTGMLRPFTIVGVLADQVDSTVGGTVKPLLLISQQQIPTTSLFYQALLETVVSFVVKTRGAVPVAAEMRSVFHDAAPGFALDNFETMQEAVDKNTFSKRLGLYLVGSFAGLAIAMVVAGLYGVLSQLVSYRRREIGVRMALGATRGSVASFRFVSVCGCGLVWVCGVVGIGSVGTDGAPGTLEAVGADARPCGRCEEEPSNALRPKAAPASTSTAAATSSVVAPNRGRLSCRRGRCGGIRSVGGSSGGEAGRWGAWRAREAEAASDSRCQSPDQRCFGPLMRSRAPYGVCVRGS